MKKNKIFLFLLILLLLTGCNNTSVEIIDNDSIKYDLTIDKSFYEKITFSFNNEENVVVDDEVGDDYVSLKDYIVDSNIYTLYYDNNFIYSKKVNKSKNATNIELSYNYTEDEFVYPKLIMSCFESYEISSKDDYFEMKLMGKFSCLNNMSKVDININTDYEVMDTNALVDGNKYHWVIDKDNEDFTFIKFKIKRDYNKMEEGSINNKGSGIFIGIIKIIGLFSVMFLLYKIYLKFKVKMDL